MIKHHRVEPGSKFRARQVDANSTAGWSDGKRKTAKVVADLNQRLHEQQTKLWAEHRRRVLVVLQGMDTSGKDGTISHVFQGVNPLGVRAVAWKAPVGAEVDHDFLWRIHAHVPGAQINDFERLLAETGTRILKFFLHIDRDEQKKRLEERLAEPEKRWKFRPEDLDDRKLWKDYMAAYEDALNRTTTECAPWFVVPANKKWYRNLVVATVLVDTLEEMQPHYQEPQVDLRDIKIE